MASISYWCLSPNLILALAGKLKSWDRTQPTPAFDWRSAVVDVVIPARNEEASIALCLNSLYEQDLGFRRVTVIDDGSTDRTAAVVRRYREVTGRNVELVVRKKPAGKTPTLREQCAASDADALVVVDADTVLTDRNYLSRSVEELFRNAGTASVCGEVRPWTRSSRRRLAAADPRVAGLLAELGIEGAGKTSGLQRALEAITVFYRSSLYLFLHRVLYDGHLKLLGSRLNPTGCAVVYRTARLRECFEHAYPKLGDNLTDSEDIFIGHFFTWKGYRNVQVRGVRCDSMEPAVTGLPRQLFRWSSAFLQAQGYFKDLPLSPARQVKSAAAGLFGRSRKGANLDQRQIREQYRAPWGQDYTHRHGRGIGAIDLLSIVEKISYPVILILLAIFAPEAALITIAVETALATLAVFAVADPGGRLRHAGMMLVSTPVRLFSLGIDLAATLKYLLDLATGNRNWRK